MRCPPIRQHHRRGRRAGAEASRLINEAGHAPRIGAGNGPGIRGTPRALGQATVHWGRQIAYPNACFPAPMRLTVLGGALQPWSRATECAQERAVGAQIRPTGIISGADRLRPTHAPLALRFHSDTAIRVGGSAGLSRTAALFSQRYHTLQALQHLQSDGIPLKTPLHLQTTPAPAQRQRNVGIPGESSCNPPNEPDFPLRTRHRLQNIPSPRPSTILLCVTKVRRVPQPALHAPGQTRALIGAGNSALEQETDHWGRLITCPNAD